MDAAKITRVTATGDIVTVSAYLRSVVLTAGADAATITVRAGGASGTVILTMGAEAAGKTASVDLGADVLCSGGIHVTVNTGTTPGVSVVYR